MRLLYKGVLAVILLSLTVSAFIPRKQTKIALDENYPHRLPNSSYPISYNINLKTNVHENGDRAFSGQVVITVGIAERTNEITLHVGLIDIKFVNIYNSSTGNMVKEDALIIFDDDRQLLQVTLQENYLEVGIQYMVHFSFEADLRTDGTGFYRASYVDDDDETVWFASTNFKTTKARQTFPCYDEPAFRTEFIIQLEHHESLKALSNMPEETRTQVVGTENVRTRFFQSSQIPTHMVAITIGKFAPIEDLNSTPIQRIYTIPSNFDEVQFAFNHSVHAMKAIEEYLEFYPPLDKMDQIYLPNMADSGNLGLLNYKEESFIYNENVHPISRKINIARQISNQFARQWFGGSVSQEWWQHTWLDEGLCSIFEFNDLVNPEWRMRDYFVTGSLHAVLQTDSLEPRPININVETPEEISSIFDEIGLTKAGAILIMLKNAVTDDVFAKGLNKYLNGRFMRSATPQDFYKYMQEALNQEKPENEINVASFMDSWVNQIGYPMITVNRVLDTLTLTQERYHQDLVEDTTKTVYSIPLNYATASNPEFNSTAPDLWMNDVFENLKSATASKTWIETDWVLFNIKQTGYYRVNYDLKLWKLLSEELYRGDHTKIDVVNRAQLIDDSFNLARSGRIPHTVPFEFLLYLVHEDDYIPWAAADRALEFLHPYLIGSDYYDYFQSMLRYGSDLFYNRLGVAPILGEPPLDVLGRNLAISWACSMGHPKCISDTTFIMDQVAQNELNIVPDLESVIYCNGLREASQDTFEAMWNLALLPQNQAKKSLILQSLGCSHSESLLKPYLESSIDKAVNYDESNRFQVISGIYSNGGLLGLNLVLEFLNSTSLEILESTFSGEFLSTIASNLADRVVNTQQDYLFLRFISSLLSQNIISNENFSKFFAKANNRITWINENMPAIELWMRYNVLKVPPTLPPQISGVTEPTIFLN